MSPQIVRVPVPGACSEGSGGGKWKRKTYPQRSARAANVILDPAERCESVGDCSAEVKGLGGGAGGVG
jgi:hypothetical protein